MSTTTDQNFGVGRNDLLERLESESIHIIREVVAEFEHPALLFSGGKDSAVMLHLAVKALWPAKLPFPVVHIDTGHNFPEVIEYRDSMVKELGVELVVGSVEDAIKNGIVSDVSGPYASRNQIQTPVLLNTIRQNKFDAVFGGARRDEERSRAKERVFSFRDAFGQWDPKNQRPELWNIYNGLVSTGQNIRVFPLSNWTELDIWRYIEQENLSLPSIYYAHEREVFTHEAMLMAVGDVMQPLMNEELRLATVRFRTVGDMTCTAAIESFARTPAEVIAETAITTVSERGESRADDRVSDAAMEDRKRQGYF
ncbi:MAG: sulfate adenylyltransferase subunit CysD [Chloroflexi bacterium]|nr:sulfate adenylyltransferase subunit CysD [Chloroflexota bacterium]|tara:strand:+ start:723 stop:1655 length:933 start_codon:yes stop_codon:yes gene_type:complete